MENAKSSRSTSGRLTSLSGFKFSIISQPPNLLSRLSAPEASGHTYRSPTPDPSIFETEKLVDSNTSTTRPRTSLLQALSGQKRLEDSPAKAGSKTAVDVFARNFTVANSSLSTHTSIDPMISQASSSNSQPNTSSSLMSLHYPHSTSPRISLGGDSSYTGLRALHSRLLTNLSTIKLPDTSEALRLSQSAQKQSIIALDAARLASISAESALNSAKNCYDIAQESLKSAEAAQTQASQAAMVVEGISLACDGQAERTYGKRGYELRTMLDRMQVELTQLGQWISEKENEEVVPPRNPSTNEVGVQAVSSDSSVVLKRDLNLQRASGKRKSPGSCSDDVASSPTSLTESGDELSRTGKPPLKRIKVNNPASTVPPSCYSPLTPKAVNERKDDTLAAADPVASVIRSKDDLRRQIQDKETAAEENTKRLVLEEERLKAEEEQLEKLKTELKDLETSAVMRVQEDKMPLESAKVDAIRAERQKGADDHNRKREELMRRRAAEAEKVKEHVRIEQEKIEQESLKEQDTMTATGLAPAVGSQTASSSMRTQSALKPYVQVHTADYSIEARPSLLSSQLIHTTAPGLRSPRPDSNATSGPIEHQTISSVAPLDLSSNLKSIPPASSLPENHRTADSFKPSGFKPSSSPELKFPPPEGPCPTEDVKAELVSPSIKIETDSNSVPEAIKASQSPAIIPTTNPDSQIRSNQDLSAKPPVAQSPVRPPLSGGVLTSILQMQHIYDNPSSQPPSPQPSFEDSSGTNSADLQNLSKNQRRKKLRQQQLQQAGMSPRSLVQEPVHSQTSAVQEQPKSIPVREKTPPWGPRAMNAMNKSTMRPTTLIPPTQPKAMQYRTPMDNLIIPSPSLASNPALPNIIISQPTPQRLATEQLRTLGPSRVSPISPDPDPSDWDDHARRGRSYVRSPPGLPRTKSRSQMDSRGGDHYSPPPFRYKRDDYRHVHYSHSKSPSRRHSRSPSRSFPRSTSPRRTAATSSLPHRPEAPLRHIDANSTIDLIPNVHSPIMRSVQAPLPPASRELQTHVRQPVQVHMPILAESVLAPERISRPTVPPKSTPDIYAEMTPSPHPALAQHSPPGGSKKRYREENADRIPRRQRISTGGSSSASLAERFGNAGPGEEIREYGYSDYIPLEEYELHGEQQHPYYDSNPLLGRLAGPSSHTNTKQRRRGRGGGTAAAGRGGARGAGGRLFQRIQTPPPYQSLMHRLG